MYSGVYYSTKLYRDNCDDALGIGSTEFPLFFLQFNLKN